MEPTAPPVGPGEGRLKPKSGCMMPIDNRNYLDDAARRNKIAFLQTGRTCFDRIRADRVVESKDRKSEQGEIVMQETKTQEIRMQEAGMPEELLKIRIGYASAAAQEVSGDMALSCELPDGRFALILSDGMGKGEQAAAESRRLVRRLRKNLKKGMAPAHAIKEVNRFMIRPDRFATMDLALLDRRQGQAKFYKMGAASSFLVRGGRVKKIDQAALPIGIVPTLKLTHRTTPLKAGDLIVMVSDGITEADREDPEVCWLQEFLRQTERETAADLAPRRLAQEILQEAQQRYACRERDDLTVLTAIVENSSAGRSL